MPWENRGSLGDKRHSHVQDTPSTLWIINHPLGFRPNVLVLNDDGVDITDGVTVEIPNTTQVLVRIGAPITGRAELS